MPQASAPQSLQALAHDGTIETFVQRTLIDARFVSGI